MVRAGLRIGAGLTLALLLTGCHADDEPSCTPTTCAAAGKECGTIPDGCGGSVTCGTCTVQGETCGGGGVANLCGSGQQCTPTTCAAQGKNCGTISDGCSDVLDCGSCTAPQTCGGGGVANVCGGGGGKLDGGGGKDTGAGPCDPACMAQKGAVCCTKCGCTGDVTCQPVCDSPAKWDCEMGCCFDYAQKKCI